MASLEWVIGGLALMALSGLPGCFLSRGAPAGQRIAVVLLLLGAGLGLAGVGLAARQEAVPALRLPWILPWGAFAAALDPISLVFLVPVFVIPALGSVYGLGYWKAADHPDNGRRLSLFYGLLAGAMGLVVIARDGVLFLLAWEVMALAAYFASTVEEDQPAVRRAGWIYLVATHIGTLCLIACFALWRRATGSFDLAAAPDLSPGTARALFLLALAGFGFKAGLMPLHVWLPGAHANAPSHVSALLSGVMLKMGVYGLVRLTALLPVPPLWHGGLLLAAGAAGGILALLHALGQHDLKRLLAYSSIENIGIIALGLGLALLGRAAGRPDWVMLGLAGALFHVWNHSLFKSLLFLNAGAVIHAAGTREMDRLGGLARRMPKTALLFVVGAVAICALPPLNGFAGEWLLYTGLFRTLTPDSAGPALPAAAAAAAALALIGALAAACFVKAFGTVFLGSPRAGDARQAHDPGPAMLAPMAALAAACAALGALPAAAAPLLDRAARAWGALPAEAPALASLAPLRLLGGAALALILGGVLLAALLRRLPRARVVSIKGTWDCGYARPRPRIQYTGSSFAQFLLGLAGGLFTPRSHAPRLHAHFPRGAAFKSVPADAVLDRLAGPLFRLAGRHLPRLRFLQQGQTHVYVLYILIITGLLLALGR